MSFTSAFVKSSFTILDFLRDLGLQAPDNIHAIMDIHYSNKREYQLLDLYMPKSAYESLTDKSRQSAQQTQVQTPKLPVIVNIHGGGWVYGTKEKYKFYCMKLAQSGYIVINFNYGLAPLYKFPIQLEDINLLFHWLFSNGNFYGMDLYNIYAVGDSAGANLLATYCNLLNLKEYNNAMNAMKSIVKKSSFINSTIKSTRSHTLADDTDKSKIEATEDYSSEIADLEDLISNLPRELHLSAIALNCGFYQVDHSKVTPRIIRSLAKDYAIGKSDQKFEFAKVKQNFFYLVPA